LKITAVDAFRLRAPLQQPFSFSQNRFTHREAMLVRVTADSGLVGWGEAYGPAVLSKPVVESYFAPMLLGRDPRDVESIWARLYSVSLDYGQKGAVLAALSACDIALWDLKARAADVPLYRLLGGEETDSVRCYATGFYWPDDVRLEDHFEQEARRYLSDGFEGMKIKVGTPGERGPERDAELVRHVRSIVGPETALMIDANHAYTPIEALRLARRIEDCEITWFEEPTSPLDPDAYLEIKNRTSIPLAGGEAEYTRFGFEPWLRARAFDYAQPDLCATGGISEGLKIASLASLTGVHVTPHTWGSAVGQSAALHFYAARPRNPFTTSPESRWLECDRSENPFREAIVESPITFERGRWKLPTGPGLGVEVQPETFARYLQ